MNRCHSLLSPRAFARQLGLFFAFLALCVGVSAQQGVRNFPRAAMRGVMQITSPPQMLLDGRVARLSPGAHIRGVNNLLLMSGTLVGQSLVVNYVRDAAGLVQDVWVLSVAEARQPLAGDAPAANYISAYAPPASNPAFAAPSKP